jgi:hypothetical protein
MISGLTNSCFHLKKKGIQAFIFSLIHFTFRNAYSDQVFKLREQLSGEFGG